jgi:hypothetical protein
LTVRQQFYLRRISSETAEIDENAIAATRKLGGFLAAHA